MNTDSAIATLDRMESLILTVRDQRVMLDATLAKIYGVPLKALNQQVKRNRTRFPEKFAFQLTAQEVARIRSQFVTGSSPVWSGIAAGMKYNPKYRPWVFTEHGALMLASVLNSEVAIQASIRVVSAFVYLRKQLAANRELSRKFAELEKRLDANDESIATLFEAIRRLLEPSAGEEPKREIGFHLREVAPPYRVKIHRRR